MADKAFVVITTINEPGIAEELCRNFARFDHGGEVGLIIIGDRKSPHSVCFEIADKLSRKGFDVEYFDVQKQEQWLKKYPRFAQIIPYNSDNRRNIGFLMALERGCDLLISLDDDNFPRANDDFFGRHRIVGTRQRLPVVSTGSGWFNGCDLLAKRPNQRIYPRGYPYSKRWQDDSVVTREEEVLVMVNSGLWLGDPDVDALTRATIPVTTMKFSGEQIALACAVWAPINSQNTCLHVDLLPAYYFVIMGERVDGFRLGRYGDIWAGLFLKKVMDHLGYSLAIGHPVVKHRRNRHDLFDDLRQEFLSILYTDLLVDIVTNLDLKGNDAMTLYDNLADQLLASVLADGRFTSSFKRYSKKLCYNQKTWLETLQKIKG